jgi:hypothetical protein
MFRLTREGRPTSRCRHRGYTEEEIEQAFEIAQKAGKRAAACQCVSAATVQMITLAVFVGTLKALSIPVPSRLVRLEPKLNGNGMNGHTHGSATGVVASETIAELSKLAIQF